MQRCASVSISPINVNGMRFDTERNFAIISIGGVAVQGRRRNSHILMMLSCRCSKGRAAPKKEEKFSRQTSFAASLIASGRPSTGDAFLFVCLNLSTENEERGTCLFFLSCCIVLGDVFLFLLLLGGLYLLSPRLFSALFSPRCHDESTKGTSDIYSTTPMVVS